MAQALKAHDIDHKQLLENREESTMPHAKRHLMDASFHCSSEMIWMH